MKSQILGLSKDFDDFYHLAYFIVFDDFKQIETKWDLYEFVIIGVEI